MQLKVEISDELPEILAAPMLYKILEAMERQENIERNAHAEWIKEAELKDAEAFLDNLQYFSYSPDTMEKLRAAAGQRIMVCQRENLEQCKQELKAEYYKKINRRWEQLDYEEMKQLTENISDKNPEELSAVYAKLKNWECDIKLKRPFLQKVRINLDYAWYKQLEKLTEDLGEKNRDEINSAAKQIKEKGYPDRIRKNAEDKLAGRSFELDMRELIGLGNDFDHFDKNTVDLLEQKALLLNTSDKSREIYREKLKERRYCIAMTEVSREVQLFGQLCEKYGITLQNLQTVMNTPDYRTCADHFCSRYNISGYSELPVFMMQGKSEIAVTSDSLFYTVGNEHYKAPFDIIFSVGISKKLLSDKLIISFRNGTSVELAAPLNKKEQGKFVDLLNEFVYVIKNPDILSGYPVLLYHTENLNLEDFIYDKSKYCLNKDAIADIFLKSYTSDKNGLGFSFYAYGRQDDKWRQLEEKVRKNFDISADNILWIYDGTILRSGKEGMAIGENMIYLKKGTQNTITIPIDKIFAVEPIGEKRGIVFKTVDDYSFICEMSELQGEMQETFANMVWEYIQGMQLVNKINRQSVSIRKNSSASSPGIVPKFCSNCGAPLGEHAKFCTKCGKKIGLMI